MSTLLRPQPAMIGTASSISPILGDRRFSCSQFISQHSLLSVPIISPVAPTSKRGRRACQFWRVRKTQTDRYQGVYFLDG